MGIDVHHDLRSANVARAREWGEVDLPWRAMELAGEVGELVEVLFSDDREVIGDELADSLICLDLLAMTAGLGPLPAVSHPACPALIREDQAARHLAIRLGRVCNTVKKLEREARGFPGSRADPPALAAYVHALAHALHAVAVRWCGPAHTHRRVEAKFNATSEKVGLRTRLQYYY